MHLTQRFTQWSAGLLLLLVLAGCGTANTATSTPTPTATSTPPFLKTATVTIQGAAKTILTTTQGLTLYYFTPDTSTKLACTGQCAVVWPPLYYPGSGTPTGPSTLTGKLSLITTPNGMQVECNGHPLYLYSKDTAPGQTNGQGLFGKWFVATPDIAPNS